MFTVIELNCFKNQKFIIRKWKSPKYIEAFHSIMQTMLDYYENEYQLSQFCFEEAEDKVWKAINKNHFLYIPHEQEEIKIHFIIKKQKRRKIL